jgi:hypothetical protein
MRETLTEPLVVRPDEMSIVEGRKRVKAEEKETASYLAGFFERPDTGLIKSAVAKGGMKALQAIPPVAFAAALLPGFDPDDPNTYIENSVEIGPVVNPLLNAVLVSIGAVRRGERTYSVGIGKESDPRTLEALVEALPGAVCYAEKQAPEIESKGAHAIKPFDSATELANQTFYGTDLKARWQHSRLYNHFNVAHPVTGALSGSAVVLNNKNSQVYAKVITAPQQPKTGLHLYPGAPSLDLYPVAQRKDPIRVTPDVAVALLEAAAEQGFTALDPSGTIAVLRAALASMVVAQRVPSAPGEALLVVGKNIKAIKGVKVPAIEKGRTTRGVQITVGEVGRALQAAEKFGAAVATHRHVADAAAMELAPDPKVAGLRHYQNQSVGLHLATEIGFVNACAPGLGKTVMTLAACQHKASWMLGWRGLVTCPAAILTQWSRESQRFFPEAIIATPGAKEIEDGVLAELDEQAGTRPLLLIVSYDTVRRCYEHFFPLGLKDLVVDEAAILKNPGSERTKALWALRKHSQVGIALTGTPIERSLDDMGRILAWARDDEALFHGSRLSKRFDVTDPDGVKAMWRAIGPCVFRRDRSEIADELPDVQTETVILDPTPAELALADGARRELKRIYQELQAKMDATALIDPNDPMLQNAREDLAKARGAALGGITLARMAASDPAAVAMSDSAGALLLDSAGLVQPAMKTGGTKRTQIVNLVTELAENGEAVLIFTDFAQVADHLVQDLAAAGVAVGVFKGGQSKTSRAESIDGYMGVACEAHRVVGEVVHACPDCTRPTLDCLVMTQAGREGLNLQRTTVLIHYDLPWMPSQVVQRVGRAARFGAGKKRLQVLVPIMAGTIEERVAAVLVPRAVIALAALDTHRGVKGSQTEVGLAIGGIEDAVSDAEKEGQESIFELAKSILGD